MKHGLLNLTILIFCLLVISAAVTKFLDVWLLDDEKRRLREKFESWWLVVSDYDHLKFALVCTQAFNRFTDLFFGEKLFSKKAFFRCSVIATGLLVGSLAFTGLLNHRLLAIVPWDNYHQSCKTVNDLADTIASSGLSSAGTITNHPNGTMTNDFTGSPTTFLFVTTNGNGDEGMLSVGYFFGKKISDLNTNLTQAQQWSNDLATIRSGVEKYDTPKDAAIYSAVYYIVLFIANVVLCFFSLVLCRIVLREICATARIVSAISLLVSNFFVVLIISTISLLVLLIFSVPLLWLLLPLSPVVAKQSFLTFVMLVFGASLGVWAMNCVPLNVIIVIAFLPSFFAVFATFFSVMLIIGRNPLHSFISAVLLRCADKSPFAVIGACFALIITIVTALAQLMRGTF
jgi:hypothetical protein